MMATFKRQNAEWGFTLIEMAIVMIVSSIMMLGFMGYYMDYRKAESVRHTKDAVDLLNSSIKQFQLANMRLPCPADPTLAPWDEGFGEEDCEADAIEVATAIGVDRDDDGNDDRILIGAVPFKELFDVRDMVPLTMADSIDGWGYKFTYAVTENLTDTETYGKERGAIDVVDEYQNSISESDRNLHYVIVSHGENGLGAYARDGNQSEPCTVLVIPGDVPTEIASLINERENCDGDDRFLIGLRRDTEYARNDDYARAYIAKDTKLWKMTGEGMAANTNVGKVGIYQTAPQEKLDIAKNVRATQIIAQEVCDQSGAADTCMPVDVLTGTRSTMRCPSGRAVARLANNQIESHCIDYQPTRPSNMRCPVGQVMTGYNRVTDTLTCVVRP